MQTALITGGSKGFGLALATSLVEDGWNVVIDGRDPVALDEAIRSLQAVARWTDGRAELPATSPTRHIEPRSCRSVADLGGLDLLVNNASTLGPSPLPRLAEYPLAALEHVVAVNVVAPLALVQAMLPLLRTSGGTVVNITSDAAVEGYEGWGGYGSSKAALEQLSKVLAAEEPDLRVYWFDPGDMRTEMHQAAFPGEDISDRPLPVTVVPALRRLLSEAPPSGRFRAADLQEVTT